MSPMLGFVLGKTLLVSAFLVGPGTATTQSSINQFRLPLAASVATLSVFAIQGLSGSTSLWLAAASGIAFSLLGGTAVYLFLTGRQSGTKVQRLEELHGERDRFLARLSHELRTPLTGVVAAIKMLHDRWQEFDPAELRELLAIADAQASEVSDLVNDMLVVARSETETLTLDRSDVDLLSLASQILASQPLSRTNISITIEDGAAIARCDPDRARQILRNLIGNAVNHAHREIRIESWLSGDKVQILVRNDGEPLDKRLASRIFEPYTAKPILGQPGPVGIGLHVSRVLARAMQGDVTYAYDGWVRFTLELPTQT